VKLPISGFSFKMNIGGRLALGFAALAVILAIAVGVTLFKVNSINSSAERIAELRVPTAEASGGIVESVHASLASLRDWMLTGNADFTQERAIVWADAFAPHWCSPSFRHCGCSLGPSCRG